MKKILIFLVFALLLFGVWRWYDEQHYRAALLLVVDETASNAVKQVDIPQGSSVTAMGRLLEEKNIILDDAVFSRYVGSTENDRKLMAGTFYLTPAMTIPEVVDVLTGETQPLEETLTIREGLTIRQIDAVLVERGLIDPGMFIDCANTCDFSEVLPEGASSVEGYLFPDTYNIVPQQFSVEAFMTRMIRTFNQRLTPEMEAEIAARGRTLDEVVRMASIVERESRIGDERAVVAGVLWNRYDAGTLIGADATLLYLKDDPRDPITYQDLQEDSPYNTRKKVGLPPTAIANPGLESLRATIFAEDTDYWYYLHDNTGQIHFGRTLEEHNVNKATYLQ